MRPCARATLTCLLLLAWVVPARAAGLERVKVSADRKGFVLEKSGAAFVPWGLNYDHDVRGRLIEDYWEAEWPAVGRHFRQMKALGPTWSAFTSSSASS